VCVCVCVCVFDCFWFFSSDSVVFVFDMCVVFASDIPPRFPKCFTYLIIRALDSINFQLLDHFQKAYAFIEDARTCECFQIASRTPIEHEHHIHCLDFGLFFFFCICAFVPKHKTAGLGVLVHCFAGISRSSTIITAYLMITNKWTWKKALEFVRSKRSQCNPNAGFRKQLVDFEKRLFCKD